MAVKLGERNGKRTAGAARPVSRAVAPAVRRRSWPLVATGVLAMAVGALAFGLARSSIDHRVAALALVRSVTAGQPVTLADLGIVEVSTSPGVSTVPASDESSRPRPDGCDQPRSRWVSHCPWEISGSPIR